METQTDSAVLARDVGIAASPALGHAHAIRRWSGMNKAKKQECFTAAAEAAQAVDYLSNLQTAAAVAA